MKLRDKYGWPVEALGDIPIINLIHYILQTDVVATWRYRNWNGAGVDPGPRYNWMMRKSKDIEAVSSL